MAAIVLLLSLIAGAQAPDVQKSIKSTGSCGRCHVASVLEWTVSKHRSSGVDCAACHGASKGHIIDERNNVKPERIPRGPAIAALCTTCHSGGCPTSKATVGCQGCHHPHALVNPNSGNMVQDQRLNELSAKWEAWSRLMEDGERFYKQGRWQDAREAFRRAAEQRADDARAPARAVACERRMNPHLSGFDILGNEFDPETGLPMRVRVAGLGIEMVLVPGGDTDIGSEEFANAAPIHTVQVGAFFLGKYELTQTEWKAVMGTNPSASDGDRLPVENISWNDCQAFLEKVNSTIRGGGFRLPTEAEWERGARSSKPFDRATLAREAWFRETAEVGTPLPVGSREPNGWRLYDMLGNVWEWCSRKSRPYPYDPSDGRESPGGADLRILRGGSFADSVGFLDPAFRHSERPDRRRRWNGMRLARSVPQ